MPLATGQQLSYYEILGPLGAGGMGEVYRARDTRLEREVAIKVLPDHFADDEERLKRFEREAKTLATLTHANVAHVYGIDQVQDTCFIVMELVPGENLAARLARGPLPVTEALDVGRQLAEGLEAAHEAGVVHRDLKPANVHLTPEGVVKVLDFGLAKPIGARADRAGSSSAEPDSFLVTEEGLVLGTPTYMSPEQARGKPVDRRTDIWAFGCVLYECLTGARAFDGEALADVMAAIVEREPDLERLPPGTPPRVAELVARSLVKDPRQRLQHLGDARVELELALRGAPVAAAVPPTGGVVPAAGPVSAARRSPAAPLLLLVLGMLLGALATWLGLRSSARDTPGVVPGAGPTRVSILIPPAEPALFPRIAPDGRAVVYDTLETDATGASHRVLQLRRLDAPDPIRLPGTERVETIAFSPDGGELAVVVRGPEGSPGLRLVRVVLDEGAPRTLPIGPHAPEPNLSGGVVWTEQDLLVTTGVRGRLLSMPVAGGGWREVRIRGLQEANLDVPEVYRGLPGGRHVFANVFEYTAGGYEPRVITIDVETGESEPLLDGGHAAWLPGHLLFTRGETLYGVGFDLGARAVTGTPRILFDGLRTAETWRPAWFDVSRDGALVHGPGGRQGAHRRILRSTAEGELVPWSADRRAFDGMLNVSRDGSFFTVGVAATSGLIELWGSEVDAPLLRPLLAAPATDFMPGPVDARRGYVYYSHRSTDELDGVWRAPIASPAQGEPLWTPEEEGVLPTAMELAPDGRALLVRLSKPEGSSLVELGLDGEAPYPVRPLFELDSETWGASISPDGRWLLYPAPVDGQRSLVVRPRLEDGTWGAVVPVPPERLSSPQGGNRYSWGEWSLREGAEHPSLLGWSRGGERMVELEVRGRERPSFGEPTLRFEMSNRRLVDYAGLRDGGVLLIERGPGELVVDRIELALDVLSLLEE